MLVSTKQLSSAHSLKDVHLDLGVNHTVIEPRVSTTKLLDTHISQSISWCLNISYFTAAKISFASILYPQFTQVIFIIYTASLQIIC